MEFLLDGLDQATFSIRFVCSLEYRTKFDIVLIIQEKAEFSSGKFCLKKKIPSVMRRIFLSASYEQLSSALLRKQMAMNERIVSTI